MEFIYVVKRYDIFDLAFPHGFVLSDMGTGKKKEASDPVAVHDVREYMKRAREKGFFVERRWAEKDSSFKQIIPYTLVTDGESVLCLRRLAKGGEPRLHGKLSIGVGGHINPPDRAAALQHGDDIVAAAAWRELEEEIHMESRVDLKIVGLVNDESNPVGSVHLGVVHVATVKDPESVRVKEADQLEGSFLSVEKIMEAAADPDSRMETWSSLVAERLREILYISSAETPVR